MTIRERADFFIGRLKSGRRCQRSVAASAFVVVSAFLFSQLGWTIGQTTPEFRLPDFRSMHALHTGRSIRDIGLAKDQVDEILKVIWDIESVESMLPNDFALEQELLAQHVDVGDGLENGLVLQGSRKLCENGNCRTWFFRKHNGRWECLQGGISSTGEGFRVQRFTFVKPNNDLVTVSHANGDNYPVRVWNLSDGIFVASEFHCWHESKRKLDQGPCVDFQISRGMFQTRGRRSISDTGLSDNEVTDVLNTILAGGIDIEEMRSVDALKQSLSFMSVDLGDGDPGLVVRGASGNFCGATGNCAIWIFRKVAHKWQPIPGDWGPELDTYASMFAFLPPRQNGLFELVMCSHLSASDAPVERWWFDGKKYLSHQAYCWHPQSGEVIAGGCDN